MAHCSVWGEVCDGCVPVELQDHFAEVQPIFKNTTATRTDIGPFMRDYAEEYDIMSAPPRMLVSNYRGDNIFLSTPHIAVVPHARTYCGSRVPSCRVRTEAVLPIL